MPSALASKKQKTKQKTPLPFSYTFPYYITNINKQSLTTNLTLLIYYITNYFSFLALDLMINEFVIQIIMSSSQQQILNTLC
jgi:hypothetical protein